MKQQLLLLCLLSLSFSLPLASVVEDTCKYVTKSKHDYDFCVTSFQASPKSRTADIYGLSVIGLELALANHTYNLANAKKLQQQSGLPPQAKKCIDVCVDVYASSISDLNQAIVSAQKKSPFPLEIGAAGEKPLTCQKAFEEAGQKDLLATENYNAFTLDCIMGTFDVFLHPRR